MTDRDRAGDRWETPGRIPVRHGGVQGRLRDPSEEYQPSRGKRGVGSGTESLGKRSPT